MRRIYRNRGDCFGTYCLVGVFEYLIIALSSSGRITDFESVDLGSNPSGAGSQEF